MPTIYEIYHGGDIAKRAFTSKEQAIKAARVEIDAGAAESVEIEKVELPPVTLAMVLDIINAEGGSYSLSRETVQTVTRGNRGVTPPAPPCEPIPDVRGTASLGDPVEIVNGREIKKYLNGSGRLIYAVGGVGFYHLDEARIYAKGVNDNA